MDQVCIADCGSPDGSTVLQDAPTDRFVNDNVNENFFCAAAVATKNFIQYSVCYCSFCIFSLVLLTGSRKLSILSKMTPSILTLDFNVIGELLIVRSGSNLASLLQVVNTCALDFSAHKVVYSSQSCKLLRYGVIVSRNFSTCGWDVVNNISPS